MNTQQTKRHVLRTAALTAVMACSMAVGALAADIGVIAGDVVNVRKGPGTGYDRVETLAKGKRVTILDEENGWYKVSWNNSTGYVKMDYVSADSNSASAAQSETANATVTGGSAINVRKGPGTGYDRVETLAKGKRVAILETSGKWYKISFDGKTGYIYSDYLIPDAKEEKAAEASAAPAVTDASVGNATVKGGSAINVRKGPGTGYECVTTVSTGKRVTLLAEEGGWFKVEFGGTTGYILGDFLAPDDGALDALVSAESAEASASAEQPAEQEIPAATATAEAVETVGSDSAQSTEGRSAIITGGTVNVRAGAGTEFERLTQVGTGKRVTIIGEENGWYLLSFDGKTGYVLSKYVHEGDSLPSSTVGEQIVALARQYVGVRYVYGGASPSGFDCSGFAMYLYKQFGYSLPHTASGQYANCGYKVSRSELQPGDLVFFTSSGAGGRINHVGIYMGNDQVIHARYSIGKVHINSLSENYYNKNYVGAVRIA